MLYESASAAEIDRKMREDFRKRLQEFGVTAELTDPVLAVLFRTFACEIERLYAETDTIRLSLLDEFIHGLGLEARATRPAQSLIRLVASDCVVQHLPEGEELLGLASSGEQLVFTTDAAMQVSSARIALALSYENEKLQLLSGCEMTEELRNLRPVLDPVPALLGPRSAIFVAVEGLPVTGLGHHSFFFGLGTGATRLQKALQSAMWCLADDSGAFTSTGVLRPRTGRAGVHHLEWLLRPDEAAHEPEDPERAKLPAGFYGGQVFVFPQVPKSRQFACAWPRALGDALGHIFKRVPETALATPRTWIRISLPQGLGSLQSDLESVWLHAMSVSNVECLNQTIRFEKHGSAIPVSKEGGLNRYIVGPLSVLGESNRPYLDAKEASNDLSLGRYVIRSGRIDLTPGKLWDGSDESYANVRLWTTAGALGNKVGPGRIAGFAKANRFETLRVLNPVSSAGGNNGEERGEAASRFAAALSSRDRVVTEQDLQNVICAFDRRVLHVSSELGIGRSTRGLQRVQRIKIELERDGFVDYEIESGLLQQDLHHYLKDRLLIGTEVQLVCDWK